MATLNFIYGTMKSGKTLTLLAEAHNFKSHNRNPYLLTAAGDTRSGIGVIRSRVGITASAQTFDASEDLYEKIRQSHLENQIDIVMVDEAQFLSRDQVFQLSDVADELGINVRCFGLRTDFRGELFEGSAALMALSDHMSENTGVCASGCVANMVLRMGTDGVPMIDGPQLLVGGEETYEAVSRKIWKERMRSAMNNPSRAVV
ncbi:thymidine kinase [Pseudosulfitobacter pseudonitzschiae]|uniref:thymidine kinase n=1 Tax=Pseudosulfitobacter pseudonitzschiae TaxID=1402135 RepID=UPI003B816452